MKMITAAIITFIADYIAQCIEKSMNTGFKLNKLIAYTLLKLESLCSWSFLRGLRMIVYLNNLLCFIHSKNRSGAVLMDVLPISGNFISYILMIPVSQVYWTGYLFWRNIHQEYSHKTHFRSSMISHSSMHSLDTLCYIYECILFIIYCNAYCIFTIQLDNSIYQGQSCDIRQQLKKTMIVLFYFFLFISQVNWAFWPIVQIINFCFIPVIVLSPLFSLYSSSIKSYM